MEGFKDSTRVRYTTGSDVNGAAKVSKIMGEFKRGETHSGPKRAPAKK
jgi:hypothetical protein